MVVEPEAASAQQEQQDVDDGGEQVHPEDGGSCLEHAESEEGTAGPQVEMGGDGDELNSTSRCRDIKQRIPVVATSSEGKYLEENVWPTLLVSCGASQSC